MRCRDRRVIGDETTIQTGYADEPSELLRSWLVLLALFMHSATKARMLSRRQPCMTLSISLHTHFAALHKPNGITVNWYRGLSDLVNAVFSRDLFSSGICQKASFSSIAEL